MSDDTKDYEVGYGKPPKHTRFKKGQSGNPKGRPKGAMGFTASLKQEMESKVTVREGGREVKVSKAEAAAKRLVGKALGGDMAALKMLAFFDEDLSTRVQQEADKIEQAVVPDQTDEDVLAYFARQIREGGIHVAGESEPGDIDDEETDP
jgi:hypothetical protein